jgi:exoribonuclease-2
MQHLPVVDLVAVARKAMREHNLIPDFPPEVHEEMHRLPSHAPISLDGPVRDLRSELWSSIDNVESRDLDQIEVAEPLEGDRVRVKVGIADVDVLASSQSALDRHAAHNTCSVYTGAIIFPMLPEVLSTGLTSLNEGVDRMAVIIEYVVEPDGAVSRSTVYRAVVHNHARLTYSEVGAYLSGGEPPPRFAERPDLLAQLRLQDQAAQRLRKLRHERGALELETIEARPVAAHGEIVALELTHKNRARELIEDFMIAANAAMARFLDEQGFSSIRRVVKEPERWQRIAALAATLGDHLPEQPSSIALAEFLARRKAADPVHFPDLSLAVVKLMGPGVYALEKPGQAHAGHFGLAVQDYTQSTAPNRRYADLITQRLVKACVAGAKAPYSDEELTAIAARCLDGANAAQKVERTLRKVAAAVFLAPRAGERFAAIVTGVTNHGTFVRLLDPPAEGRVIQGERGMDVGDKVEVRLLRTEPAKGFIDFVRA